MPNTMPIILYPKAGTVTARKISKISGWPMKKPSEISGVPEKIFRWGTSLVACRAGGEMLNTQEAVALSVKKDEMRAAFLENGVPCTKVYKARDEFEFPLMRRNKGLHSQGKGIVILEADEEPDFDGYTYLEILKNKANDLRAIVFKNKIIALYVWVRKSDDQQDEIVRNDFTGWKQHSISIASLTEEMRESVVRANTALGLTFSAVDFGITEQGRIAVYETNTAPTISKEIISMIITGISM